MCNSEKQINFVYEPSRAGKNSFQFAKYKNGNGGIIRAAAFVGSTLNDANKVEGAAHELFHAYQFINGRNVVSANAEVEAYLFGNGVAANSKYGSMYYPFISGNQTKEGDMYGRSMLNLIIFDAKAQGKEEFSKQFNNAVHNFLGGNISSYTGMYKSPIDENYKPLIHKFLPLR